RGLVRAVAVDRSSEYANKRLAFACWVGGGNVGDAEADIGLTYFVPGPGAVDDHRRTSRLEALHHALVSSAGVQGLVVEQALDRLHALDGAGGVQADVRKVV